MDEAQRRPRPVLAGHHLESPHKNGRAPPGAGTLGAWRRPKGHQHSPGFPDGGCHAAVPQYPSHGAPVQGRDDSFPAGSLAAGTSGPDGLHVSCPAVPHGSVVRDWSQTSGRHTQTLSPGAAAAEASLAQVGSLALHNPNNYCYQHTFVLTWMWTMLQVPLVQGPGRLKEDVVGQGYNLMQQLLHRQPRRLHHAMAWGTFVQTWQRQQAQHDVTEFSSHVLKLLNPPCMQGRWQSRLQDPNVRVCDQGTLMAPIVLCIPESALCLQDCVNAWHSQLAIHGLEASSRVVLLQLGRFAYTEGGPVRKLRVRLSLGDSALLPVFSHGLRTQWRSFKIVAGIYHLGNRPTAGHYRAFLNGSGNRGSAANPDEPLSFSFPSTTLHTEDGVPATPLRESEVENICRNVYMLWCVRDSDPEEHHRCHNPTSSPEHRTSLARLPR